MTMSSREAWTSLAERVEKAGGSDREIDVAVARLLFPNARGSALALLSGKLTASVDAVLELIEKLPATKSFAPVSPPSSGWKIGLYRGMTPTGQPHAMWNGMVRQHGKENDTNAATPALALLAAYCRARAASVIEIAGSGERAPMSREAEER